jgi:hypothetical protein
VHREVRAAHRRIEEEEGDTEEEALAAFVVPVWIRYIRASFRAWRVVLLGGVLVSIIQSGASN